ncbi:MAG: glycosyltransferase family 4 protein [Candidatus Rokubacteria bacterium]|nr:glycosyltransferase family 4 protein [Candidatus Rokubacteria bacterium]
MLRACLPKPEAVGGGTASFYQNLRTFLASAGIPFTDRLEDAWDVLFVNSWGLSFRTALHAKRSHPSAKLLHRVDGSALDYGREAIADLRQARVNLLADLTVFQSQYGRHATTRKYRVIRQDGPVIHNPVDVERFRPEGERVPLPGKVRVCAVTHSTNPRKGAAALYALAAAHSAVQFILVGRYEGLPALGNLHFLGYADRDALPRLLRSCDVFLMLAENEACPNVVLEAMASGLPVLYRDSGGTPELVGDCGRAVEPETFADALAWALEAGKALGEAARRRAVERFSPAVVFPRYLEALERCRRRPLPRRLDWPGLLRVDPAILLSVAGWGAARAAARLWVSAR